MWHSSVLTDPLQSLYSRSSVALIPRYFVLLDAWPREREGMVHSKKHYQVVRMGIRRVVRVSQAAFVKSTVVNFNILSIFIVGVRFRRSKWPNRSEMMSSLIVASICRSKACFNWLYAWTRTIALSRFTNSWGTCKRSTRKYVHVNGIWYILCNTPAIWNRGWGRDSSYERLPM